MHNSTEDLYDIIYSSKDYQKEATEIKDYILNRFPGTKTILDVACGTGKHAGYLNHFFKVDGIDISKRFVEIAQERNPTSTFWCKDMTSFELDKQYDIVMCLFSAIAYAKSFQTLTQTLKQMKKHTKHAGYIIIEPWFTPETWYSGYVSIVNGETNDVKVSRMSFSDQVGKISILNFEYLVGTKEGIKHLSEKHELGLYSVNEMLFAFKEAGFDTEYDPQGISGRGLYISKVLK
ncbi:dTDP-3-amino-3,6-dideoxy-alpha-D-glucopyranose N,N-dimethyltransferase [Paenibacillus konkukensis]|uniref:dTDP-3-amino-3,6-dideoxy-alpha-D-glucopyranose N,N-dimethyltransferase n=1 Tax=Paenibacillus konkukensis TaxID=2020716 RepID=A0ABY4S2N7_9BACL|nr:class I SAM-dependent methyltransferase [Paenibacillus konkukensis]UQZ87532.1 dTDP-3-amino-3,6-dideoxy-alpha-D-glucopyranose N,N-dimethyltransferase [Paenibacillus konkukensis]